MVQQWKGQRVRLQWFHDSAGETYVTTTDGQRMIAASRRPDGTVRKAIPVRHGYVPQEEQLKYTPKAKREEEVARVVHGAFATRSGVPGADFEEEETLPAKKKKKSRRRKPKAEPAEFAFDLKMPTFPEN